MRISVTLASRYCAGRLDNTDRPTARKTGGVAGHRHRFSVRFGEALARRIEPVVGFTGGRRIVVGEIVVGNRDDGEEARIVPKQLEREAHLVPALRVPETLVVTHIKLKSTKRPSLRLSEHRAETSENVPLS